MTEAQKAIPREPHGSVHAITSVRGAGSARSGQHKEHGGALMLFDTGTRRAILLIEDLTCKTALREQNIVPGTGDKDIPVASFAKFGRLKQRLPRPAIVALLEFAAEDALSRASRNPSDV